MKRILFLLLFFCLFQIYAHAQNYKLVATSNSDNKRVFFKSGSRLVVELMDKEEYSGKLEVFKNQILIHRACCNHQDTIELYDISEIRYLTNFEIILRNITGAILLSTGVIATATTISLETSNPVFSGKFYLFVYLASGTLIGLGLADLYLYHHYAPSKWVFSISNE